MIAPEKLLEAAKALEPQLQEWRRTLHRHPEVGFDLPQTKALVKKALTEMGYTPQDCGKCGVVALAGGKRPGKVILLRGDMDALPLQEESGEEFSSELPGKMHGCGHDMHTAMVLGAAKLLKEHEDEIEGTVKLEFQPAEEIFQGSLDMINSGLLENPKVDAAFALHIFSTTPVGEVTYCTGVTSSSLDSFIVNIQGKGGHSSTPQLSIDPLMIANQIYTAANMLMTREVDPKATATLSAGVLRSGTAVNILPDTATLQMGMRTYDKEARAHILERLPQIIDHYVKAWRGDYELVTFNCPCTYTDDTVSHELLPAIAEIVGEENISNTGPMAGTEDFSYVAEAVPSMFICLGAGGPDQYPHHNPRMVLDESVFFQGAAIHANCAMEWLNKHGK